MRSAAFLAAFASTVAAVPLEARQMAGMDMSGGHKGMGSPLGGGSVNSVLESFGPLLQNPAIASLAASFIPKKAAYKIEQIAPKLGREGAKRVRLTYGPYQLKGKNVKGKLGNFQSMDPAGTAYNHLATDDFPRDVTVLFSTSHVALENMKRAEDTDGVYNHHNVFFDFSNKVRQAMTCADKKIKPTGEVPVSVFMAGATEAGNLRYTSRDATFNSGYYIGPKDVIYNGLDVVNYNNETINVYTVSEMEYMPGKVKDALSATQQTINLGLCTGTDGVSVQPGAGVKNMTIDGSGMMINEDGYLLNTRGHLHDGGVNMAISIGGKVVCDSRVQYGGPGYEYTLKDGSKVEAIRTTTECDKPIEVKKGDKVDVVANYDFVAHPQRESADGEMGEGMALVILTFVSKDKL